MDINTLEGFEFMEGDCKCHLAYGLAATTNDTIVDGDVYSFSFLFKLM